MNGLGFDDQAAAAVRDANNLFHRVAARVGGTRTETDPDPTRVIFLAVLLTDLIECPHLSPAPQPVVARLALGSLDCHRCATTTRPPPAEHADRCDVCHTHGHSTFYPFVIQLGAVVFIGDACPTCAAALCIPERSES